MQTFFRRCREQKVLTSRFFSLLSFVGLEEQAVEGLHKTAPLLFHQRLLASVRHMKMQLVSLEVVSVSHFAQLEGREVDAQLVPWLPRTVPPESLRPRE